MTKWLLVGMREMSQSDKRGGKQNLFNPVRGEIYWANLEPVQGSEQGNSRPVLIVSNNLMNENAQIVIAVPLTRSGERTGPCPLMSNTT